MYLSINKYSSYQIESKFSSIFRKKKKIDISTNYLHSLFIYNESHGAKPFRR